MPWSFWLTISTTQNLSCTVRWCSCCLIFSFTSWMPQLIIYNFLRFFCLLYLSGRNVKTIMISHILLLFPRPCHSSLFSFIECLTFSVESLSILKESMGNAACTEIYFCASDSFVLWSSAWQFIYFTPCKVSSAVTPIEWWFGRHAFFKRNVLALPTFSQLPADFP